MLYIKFDEKYKVLIKTQDEAQANFYGLDLFEGELEKGYDGSEYKKGYAPEKPAVIELEKQLKNLEIQYNMPRVIREGILGNPTAYSEFNVNRAKDLEDIAKKVRDLRGGK